jgi:hypothetical protein
LTKSKTDKAEPTLEKDRRDNADPKQAQSRTEIEDPKRAQENTKEAKSSFAGPLEDSSGSNSVKFNAIKDRPHCANPDTVNRKLRVAGLCSEGIRLKWLASNTDDGDSRHDIPETENADPRQLRKCSSNSISM